MFVIAYEKKEIFSGYTPLGNPRLMNCENALTIQAVIFKNRELAELELASIERNNKSFAGLRVIPISELT